MVKSRPISRTHQSDDKIDTISGKPASSYRSKRLLVNSVKKEEFEENTEEQQGREVLEKTPRLKKQLANNRTRQKQTIKNEAAKHDGLNIKRVKNKQSQKESEKIKAERRKERKERNRQKILKETAEQREKRLEYMRERQRERIKAETTEQRANRLWKMRAYQSKIGTSDECLEYMRERQKQRIKAETPEERSLRLEKMKLYQQKRARKRKRKVPKKTTKGKDQSILKESEDITDLDAKNREEGHAETSEDKVLLPFRARRYGGIWNQREEKSDGNRNENEELTQTDFSVDDHLKANMPD